MSCDNPVVPEKSANPNSPDTPVIAELKSVTVYPSSIVIELKAKPSAEPVAGDFTIKQQIDTAAETNLTLKDFVYDEKTTVTFSFSTLTQTAVEQKVTLTVALKGAAKTERGVLTIPSTGTTYRITYDGNGHTGGVVPAEEAYAWNEQWNWYNAGTLVKAGYDFMSWNTKKDGTGIDVSVMASVFITENTTLYAQWVVADAAMHLLTDKDWKALSGTTWKTGGGNGVPSDTTSELKFASDFILMEQSELGRGSSTMALTKNDPNLLSLMTNKNYTKLSMMMTNDLTLDFLKDQNWTPPTFSPIESFSSIKEYLWRDVERGSHAEITNTYMIYDSSFGMKGISVEQVKTEVEKTLSEPFYVSVYKDTDTYRVNVKSKITNAGSTVQISSDGTMLKLPINGQYIRRYLLKDEVQMTDVAEADIAPWYDANTIAWLTHTDFLVEVQADIDVNKKCSIIIWGGVSQNRIAIPPEVIKYVSDLYTAPGVTVKPPNDLNKSSMTISFTIGDAFLNDWKIYSLDDDQGRRLRMPAKGDIPPIEFSERYN